MLGHRVDERVPRASVLQEEAAHTRRDRPKVPPLQQHGEGKRQDAAGGCEHAVAQLGVLGAATGDAALFSQGVNQSEDLVDEEDDERRNLLHAFQRRPCDDGDLHGANRAELTRLAALDGGLSYAEATDRVNLVEGRMHAELDTARKAAGYGALWIAFALLFGAVVAVAAAISAGWEDDKLSFGFARRY